MFEDPPLAAVNNPSAEKDFEDAVTLLDEDRKAVQRVRVRELRSEAEFHQRRADSFNDQADLIERTWGLREVPAEPPRENTPAFESFRENPCSLLPALPRP